MIANLRDLGGIKTASGKTIKYGCFVRSANLSQAEDKDLAGISEIIDLRTTRERNEIPDLVHGRSSLAIPIFDEVKRGVSHERETEAKPERKGPPDMGTLYKWMIQDHAESFGKALSAIMNHDYSTGAVLWHCTEGKDRCGFASMVLEALMGATPDEIIADYMVSYENYYGLEPGTEKYDMVISKNIMLMLPIIAGTDDLESVDLAAATEAYLLKHGMDPDSLAALKDKLSRA